LEANPRFEDLIAEGRAVLAQCDWNGYEYKTHFPPEDAYLRFRTEAMNLVRRSCGQDSDHYRELRRLAESKDSANNGFYLIHAIGMVEAAKNDFDAGLLTDMRSLITAEVFADFIEQAERLLEAGYYVSAASLTGAILEDALRKLCEKSNISVPASTKIDRLNAELAKAGIYDKLIQKRITALADLRNNADHGHFDKFRREDVEDMVKWVRSFTADFLR
jgi:HEPN domain-containing protein